MMIRLETLWSFAFIAFCLTLVLADNALWVLAAFVVMNLAQVFNDRLDGPFEQFTPGKIFQDSRGFVFQAVCPKGSKYIYPDSYKTRRAAERAQRSFCRTPRSWNHLL